MKNLHWLELHKYSQNELMLKSHLGQVKWLSGNIFLNWAKCFLKEYDSLTENRHLAADWSESSYTEERKEIEYFSLVSVQEINQVLGCNFGK